MIARNRLIQTEEGAVKCRVQALVFARDSLARL